MNGTEHPRSLHLSTPSPPRYVMRSSSGLPSELRRKRVLILGHANCGDIVTVKAERGLVWAVGLENGKEVCAEVDNA